MPSIRPSHTIHETRPTVSTGPSYTQPAPADEVMMEQLEYLLLHARTGHHLACAECARLERIGAMLLSPFQETSAFAR